MRTISTPETSLASGCRGSECATSRPRLSTTYTSKTPPPVLVVISRIGCRLATASTTPATLPAANTGSPSTTTGSCSEGETIGTEIIGVPCWPRWNASSSCSRSRASCSASPDCAPLPVVSTTLTNTMLPVAFR